MGVPSLEANCRSDPLPIHVVPMCACAPLRSFVCVVLLLVLCMFFVLFGGADWCVDIVAPVLPQPTLL